PGGTGRFAVILDPLRKLPGQQPYQGIVPLVGDTVASALEHYMAHSEQLQTRIWLEANPQAAAGLLLQQLPLSGGNAPTATDGETWNRSQQLAGTLQPGELLATDSET